MKKPSGFSLRKRLTGKREKIDLIDRKLLSLLNQRLRLALEIGRIKKELGAKIYDPRREREVLGKLIVKNKGPLKEGDLKKILTMIVRVCRQSQA